MRFRLYKAIRNIILLITVGIAYYLFGKYTGYYVPCVFYSLTGLYCPGCGVTRMSIALLEGDLIRAYQNNAAVLILLPFLAFEFFWHLISYIKMGNVEMSKKHTYILYAITIGLVIYGVLRNLPYFDNLRPIDG